MDKTIYKVWVEVEEINEDKDHYQNIDLPFASCAVFENEESAINFAKTLHEIGEQMHGTDSQSDNSKREPKKA